MTEHRTETQALEDRIINALATIRDEWGHMMPTGPSGSGTGARTAKSARITAADNANTSHDIDATTRLVSDRRDVTSVLAIWVREVIRQRSITNIRHTLAYNDVPGMCAFLERHAEWLSENTAEHTVGSLERAAQTVLRHAPPPIVDTPPPPRPHHIGTCPMLWEAETDDGKLEMRECGGDVRAYPAPYTDPTREEQIRQPLPTCNKCGTDAHIDWWYREMYGKHGVSHLVTTEELVPVIAARLDYIATRDQIRQWKHRGKIAAHSKDSKGRTLYNHDDVISALESDISRLREKRA